MLKSRLQPVRSRLKAVLQRDGCGAWMRRLSYGRTDDEYGREIDHILPVAKGGGDEPGNLQPLHWNNNRHKGDTYPNWTCAVT